MMISLAFIVGFFSLLLLPITCITILFSLQPHPHSSTNTAAASAKPHPLGSIWRLLLNPTASGAKACKDDGDRVGARRFAGRREGGEAEECRVCLCEVEEGEEISDLRCNHLFHKVCLDAWIGSGHATCPLCRGRVFAPSESESEVVMFEFCSLSSSRRGRRENWWLR